MNICWEIGAYDYAMDWPAVADKEEGFHTTDIY